MKELLLIVDAQNDFMPGGSLPVPDGHKIVPVINRLTALGFFDLVIASQDWHPEEHCSFGEWPVHCVAGTTGAELHPAINQSRIGAVVRKGIDKDKEEYSAFMAANLPMYLDTGWDIFFVGLALDVCVLESIRETINYIECNEYSNEVFIVTDGCKGIADEVSILKQIMEEMPDVKLISSLDIL